MVDSMALTEWLANNYNNFGAELEFVTDRSQEGSQFCKGFGGLGGLLRYRVDFAELGGDHFEYDSGISLFVVVCELCSSHSLNVFVLQTWIWKKTLCKHLCKQAGVFTFQ